ncbi:MAG: hypothetical protein AB8G16_09515 [Gammaproteobacteria bacterium]
MKNNRLSFTTAFVAGLIFAQTGGCASNNPNADNAPEAAAIALAPGALKSSVTTDEGHLGGVTRFTEASVQALVEDDFWDTGMVAQRGHDGRLTYVSKTEAVNDPDLTRQELSFYQMRSGFRSSRRGVLYDPVTGLPLTPNGIIRNRVDGRVTPSAVPDQRRVRPIRSAPVPRPVQRRPTTPTRNSESRDSRR